MKYLINYIINPIKEHFRYKRNYTKMQSNKLSKQIYYYVIYIHIVILLNLQSIYIILNLQSFTKGEYASYKLKDKLVIFSFLR